MKKKLLTIIFIICSSATAFGQVYIGVSGKLAIPYGTFAKNVNIERAAGVGLNLLFNAGDDSPIIFGLEGGYLLYGYTERNTSNAVITNNIANANAVFRIGSSAENAVSVYMEGLAGGSYVYTSTSLKDKSLLSQVGIYTNTKLDVGTWSLCYGGSVGLSFGGAFRIDIKCTYLNISNVKFYDTSTILSNSSTPKVSPIELIMPQIGISIVLD